MKPKIVVPALCALIAIAVCLMIALGHRSQNVLKPSASIHGSIPVPTKTFIVHGTIRNVDIANGVLRIAHEEIPNYMPAMTMPFTVKEPALLNGLTPGDSVQFELAVTDNDSWISHVETLPAGKGAASSANGSTA